MRKEVVNGVRKEVDARGDCASSKDFLDKEPAAYGLKQAPRSYTPQGNTHEKETSVEMFGPLTVHGIDTSVVL